MPLASSRIILLPLVLVLMTLMAEMSTDIYIPCLPEMASYFAVGQHTVVVTISSYLLGFSLAGSLAGPFSDNFGRRPLFLLGSFVFTLASVGCTLVDSANWLIAIRFIQGIGAGIAYVTTNAIIKDIYNEKMSSRIFSFMGMMVTMSPMVAPILGGVITAYWGWKANFYVILVGALIGFSVHVFRIPESLKPEHRQVTLSYHKIVGSYKILLKTPRVIGFSLISGVTYGGLWTWIAAAPFYFINVVGIDPKHYGYYSAVGPAAYIVGTIINQIGVGIFGTIRMLQYGLFCMTVGSLLLFMVMYLHEVNLIGIYSTFSVYGIGMALVFANSAAHAVNVEPRYRGTASSILSTVEMSFAALSCYLISLVSNNDLRPATFTMFICSLVCIYLFHITARAEAYRRKTI
ncbi:multidrug effflux MFS transporter [Candidatus Paracaedibacter symbiosus]|uniref:multidrug effflux MFS transporter n=1 Tax=Candidatus Paracaedibacter symbiosus TaxID=244582 RepID=UPI00094E0172|nr:multidrug effflux MFS transporter [Candidatus Paracaedibacter symbiosus]